MKKALEWILFSIFIGIWIVFKENIFSSVVWIFFLAILGNLTTAIYILYSLKDSNGDINKFFMGKNI